MPERQLQVKREAVLVERQQQVRGSDAELRGSKCGDWSGDLCTTTLPEADIAGFF